MALVFLSEKTWRNIRTKFREIQSPGSKLDVSKHIHIHTYMCVCLQRKRAHREYDILGVYSLIDRERERKNLKSSALSLALCFQS